MEAAAVTVARPRAVGRWAFLAGVLYVVLFVIGTIVIFDGQPDTSSNPAKVIAYWSDSGHRDKVNVGWILIGLAIFFLLWFIAALWRAVSSIDTERTLSAVVAIGGAVYAACTIAAVSIDQGLKTMSDDTFRHRVFPELIHAADDVSWVMHASGAVGLGAMIVAASLALMWAGAWPSWAGWVSVVIGILTLGSIAFFPQFLFLAWILVVSIVMFRYEPRVTRT
jgi:hypothetical protein